MAYLNWDTKIVQDFSNENINILYDDGYLATRVDKGIFNRTRSLRIKLADFILSSENRRILAKMEKVILKAVELPYKDYHWSIHKMAKDFYTTKFGADTFSANKVKELLTKENKSNFNLLLIYSSSEDSLSARIGYCICLLTDKILHYSYPFYKMDKKSNPSLGLGMMTRAALWAAERNLEYIYLGSLQRPADTYKLQFSGLEWFDGQYWQKDLAELKKILK